MIPRSLVNESELSEDRCAVLSWRWDRSAADGRSRNLALALKHAKDSGIRHLFVDLVTVDQSQKKEQLLRSVVGLSRLYQTIPVIAAYDETDVAPSERDRTMGRPWILSEARTYSQNPSSVTYVGYRHGADSVRELSFANSLSVIRSSGFASCILGVMQGHVRMMDVADFAYILAGSSDVVAAYNRRFCRSDYLLATFLLALAHEKTQQVEDGAVSRQRGFRTDYGSLSFESIGLERFGLAPYDGPVRAYEWAKTLQLDGVAVAIWWTKMTSSFDRNWIEVLPNAVDRILETSAASDEATAAYRSGQASRTAFLQIPATAPAPWVRELGADLTEGRWLQTLPAPRAQTVGFNPDLWLRRSGG